MVLHWQPQSCLQDIRISSHTLQLKPLSVSHCAIPRDPRKEAVAIFRLRQHRKKRGLSRRGS